MTKKNTAATIITIIVAALALATTLFLLYKMSQSHTDDVQGDFVPSDEVNEEMTNNATTLIKSNYEVFKVFLYHGLPFQEEPYGNLPEDGLYEVKSEDYKTMQDLEKLVNDTFVEKEAARILTDVNDNGAVYQEKTLIDGSKAIGLRVEMVDSYNQFIGVEYNYTWENARFLLNPKSNTECDIIIELSPLGGQVIMNSYPNGSDADSVDSSADSVDNSGDSSAASDNSGASNGTKKITAVMLKVNGNWRLQKLVY